jgi:type VI secretion system protein ImpH
MSYDIGPDSALARDTARFGFFQALRLIESMHAARPRLGASMRPADDVIRLGQTPQFGFVSAELDTYRPMADDRPGKLTVNVAGLFGANSPMPLYFMEYVHNRVAHESDPTLVNFLDIFHHRLLSLFYRAWAVSQPVVGLDRGDVKTEGYGRYVNSLCGLATQTPSGSDAIGDLDTLQFSSLLATRTRHASGLGLLLSQYFGVPVMIQQFVGQWLKLSDQDRTVLQRYVRSRLGDGLVLGGRVWDRQNKFRVIMGPVGAHDMQRLLPGTVTHRRLIEWVNLYTGGVLDWEVELRVKPEAAPGIRLDGSARLARTSWVGRKRTLGKSSALYIRLCNRVRDRY